MSWAERVKVEIKAISAQPNDWSWIELGGGWQKHIFCAVIFTWYTIGLIFGNSSSLYYLCSPFFLTNLIETANKAIIQQTKIIYFQEEM